MILVMPRDYTCQIRNGFFMTIIQCFEYIFIVILQYENLSLNSFDKEHSF